MRLVVGKDLDECVVKEHLFAKCSRDVFEEPPAIQPPKVCGYKRKTWPWAHARLWCFLPFLSGVNALYGHIHIAKTGGTSLNGRLALHANGVCGHKGYSRDYAEFNREVKQNEQWTSIVDTVTNESRAIGIHGRFNRGRVPYALMRLRGYAGCKYISMESHWAVWKLFGPIELHVPCRDPIDHLLSQCNHMNIHFHRNRPFQPQIDRCLIGTSRFDTRLLTATNITLRCYPFTDQFTTYLSTMIGVLGPSHTNNTYNMRHTNRPRLKLPTFSRDERAELVRLLWAKWAYYRFCESCTLVGA